LIYEITSSKECESVTGYFCTMEVGLTKHCDNEDTQKSLPFLARVPYNFFLVKKYLLVVLKASLNAESVTVNMFSYSERAVTGGECTRMMRRLQSLLF